MAFDLTGSNVDPRHMLWRQYYNNDNGGGAFSMASKGINDQTNKAVTNLLSRFSNSGLSRSGIQGAALNNLYGQANNALGNTAVNADQAAQQRKLQILQMLFGEQRQQDSEPSAFGSILGSLISGGAQVGSAAILASDKRLKENIEYTGEKTKDGIPVVDYNYKGNPKKFRGVIAQDVEKVKPGAVYKAVDYAQL